MRNDIMPVCVCVVFLLGECACCSVCVVFLLRECSCCSVCVCGGVSAGRFLYDLFFCDSQCVCFVYDFVVLLCTCGSLLECVCVCVCVCVCALCTLYLMWEVAGV